MLAALGSFWTRSKRILFNRLRKILLRFAHDSTGWCCWILKPLPSQNTELKSIVYHFFLHFIDSLLASDQVISFYILFPLHQTNVNPIGLGLYSRLSDNISKGPLALAPHSIHPSVSQMEGWMALAALRELERWSMSAEKEAASGKRGRGDQAEEVNGSADCRPTVALRIASMNKAAGLHEIFIVTSFQLYEMFAKCFVSGCVIQLPAFPWQFYLVMPAPFVPQSCATTLVNVLRYMQNK